MNDSNCAKVALPYPDLKVSERNCMYAQLLMQDFSASKGEDTAIHQYLYQAWTLRESYPEIYNTLMCISKVEMYHLNVLGNLITMLGGNPKYMCYHQNYTVVWNGNMVNYNHNVKQILLYDIALELYAFDSYTAHAKAIKDENVSAMLSRLALDEHLHMEMFQNCLEKLS